MLLAADAETLIQAFISRLVYYNLLFSGLTRPLKLVQNAIDYNKKM